MSHKIIITTLIWGLFFSSIALYSQQSTGGIPPSFLPTTTPQGKLKTERLAGLNLKKVYQEDEANPGNSRFSVPIPTNFSLDQDGLWSELENGDRIWRLKIQSKDALALMVFYDQFYLPPGAQLFMYSEDMQQVVGAYTHQNNRPNRKFMTGLIYGDVAIIEYFEPNKVRDQGSFRIHRVDHAYHQQNIESLKTDVGFGAADLCNVNINCPQADEYEDQKRSVCRIYVVVEEGIGFCSGALINNTNLDGTPYVLSAFHCQDGYTPLYDMWRFDFNFEGPACLNPFTEPNYDSMLGCVQRSGRQENDFLLLEIDDIIPNSYDVHFSGWDRIGAPPDTSVSIHHPRGDIKKFSRIDQQMTIHPFPFNWDNGTTTPPNLNFRGVYTMGLFEGGSSGSPLLSKSGHIIAQLHGGFIYCEGSVGYFGRISSSWEGGGTPETRLRDWLDPANTGDLVLDGMDFLIGGEGTISGYVTNEIGLGIANVEMHLTGTKDTMVLTNEQGFYEFTNVPYGGIYEVTADKDVNAKNGVSTFDLVKITQHIIGLSALGSPYKMLASDVNNSNTISTLDLIFIRRIILSIDPEFAEVPSWFFMPFDYVFDDPEDPFSADIPPGIMINSFSESVENVDFMGVKMGDVNNSANTEE